MLDRKAIPTLIILFVVCLGWSTPLVADTPADAQPDPRAQPQWNATFAPTALETYFEDDIDVIFVASIGTPGEETELVTSAIINALDRPDVPWSAYDQRAVGSIEGMDDAEIIQRAERVGADRIVIARLFEDDSVTPNVTITVYDDRGKVTASTVTSRGNAIKAHDDPEQTDEEVATARQPPSAATSPSDEEPSTKPEPEKTSPPDTPPESETAERGLSNDERRRLERQYEEEKIEWHGDTAYQSGRPLEGEHFYHTVGKSHLAGDYSELRWGWFAGGLFFAAMVPLALVTPPYYSVLPWMDYVIAAGNAGLAIHSFYKWRQESHPLNLQQRRVAAARHNRELKYELGLSASVIGSPQPATPASPIYAGPPTTLQDDDRGLALHLQLRF